MVSRGTPSAGALKESRESVADFNEISHSAENVLLLNYNIRSVSRNIDSFIVLLNSMRRCSDITVTFRTWLEVKPCSGTLIPGYADFHTVRVNARSGGVTVFLKSAVSGQLSNHHSVTYVMRLWNLVPYGGLHGATRRL